jgi:ubiquinone/menaquinone biosynthesis C-methylase UbiE
MDTPEDAREYEAIDNRAVNEEFADRAIALAPLDGLVLDAGTGPGHIAVLIAKRAPGLQVIATDLAEEMLALARAHTAAAGLLDRVTIVRADAKATPFPDGRFDMVLSNSMVHHLPEPERFFVEVHRVVRKAGAIFIKDLLRPETEDEWRALVERYAGQDSPYQRRLFSDSLRAALRVEEVTAMCAAAGITGATIRQTSDRHWVVERKAAARA